MFDGIGKMFEALMACAVVGTITSIGLGLFLAISLFCNWLTWGGISTSGTLKEVSERVETEMADTCHGVYSFQLHKVEQHTHNVPEGEFITWRNGQWWHVRPVDSPFLPNPKGD